MASQAESTAPRGFPRLKHKISNIFSHSSKAKSHTSQPRPDNVSSPVTTPVLESIAGSPNTSPQKTRTSKPRSRRREQSKSQSKNQILQASRGVGSQRLGSPQKKLELPKLEGLQWGSEFELHVPYLNFEPSRSGNAIDWDKELETYKRQSRDITHLDTNTKIPQVIPSPIDDGVSEVGRGSTSSYVPRGRKIDSVYSEYLPSTSVSKQRSNTFSKVDEATPVVHHVFCQECRRPQSEIISNRVVYDDATGTYMTTRDQISSRSSYNNSPYLATESKEHSTRNSPSLFGEKPGSRPPIGTSSGATHKKSPSLSTTAKLDRRSVPVPTATSVSAARKKWEVKEVTLLQPVGSAQNAAAANVSKTIEAINTGDINAAFLHKEPTTRSGTKDNTGLGLNLPTFQDSAFASKTTSLGAPTPGASRRPSAIPQDADRLSMIEKRRSLNSTYTYEKPSPSLDGDRGRQQALSTRSTSQGSRNPSASVRRSSSRISGDRLSWINPHDASSRAEGKVFSKLSGGVAAKLAKFENQGVTSHPSNPSVGISRQLTRSDSSNSRTSDAYSIGANSSLGAPSLALTRRTTVETPAATDKGSVMTNFDESFRQRMEMLAGSLADKASGDDNSKNSGLKGKASALSLRHQVRSDEEIGEVSVDNVAREKQKALMGDMLRAKTSMKAQLITIPPKQQEKGFNAAMLPVFA